MKIEIVDTKAYIYTPYNAEFVKAIKGIGGARWNRVFHSTVQAGR